MRKLFKAFYNLVDKLIVIPISRFIYFLKKKLGKSRGSIDKILNRPRFLIYLSLALAIIVFLFIDNIAISLIQSEAEVIRNVPVKVNYNDEAYVVEGVPDTVDITISGSKEHIYLAKQLGDHEVVLDLTEYTASDSPYRVEFTYSKSIESLDYNIDPSYVSVTISKKVSDVKSIAYDLLNIDSLSPELSVKSVTLDKSEVVVKGSEEALSKIASIKALVDLKDEKLTEAGTYDLTDVELVAYDNSGEILNNIEIVPTTVGATVTLDSYSKSLPLQINTTGSLIAGKAIAAIQINGKDTYSLDVYGDKEELDLLNSVPVTIDIDDLGKDSVKTYNVSLTKPSGVRYMSDDTVTISVTFGDEKQETIDIGNAITPRGLGEGLSANIVSNDNITVQVKGVTSVIDDIDQKDIVAYVDLSGLDKGEHEVEVKIENTNPLVTYVVSSTITVKIS